MLLCHFYKEGDFSQQLSVLVQPFSDFTVTNLNLTYQLRPVESVASRFFVVS